MQQSDCQTIKHAITKQTPVLSKHAQRARVHLDVSGEHQAHAGPTQICTTMPRHPARPTTSPERSR